MLGLARGTVELRSHREEWHDRYETEAERLEAGTGGRLSEFEHVGSTAVEGIPAKPIIDVLAVVDDVGTATDLVPTLESLGYEYRPNDGVPDRRFFAKGPRTNRTHYLSLVERGSDCYEETTAFVAYLREHPVVAESYADLKRRLAAEYPKNRARYTAEKSAFVRAVLNRTLDG